MTAQRGVAIGAATALLGTVASGPLGLWLVGVTHPQPPWRDAETFVHAYHVVQIVPYLAGLLLVGGFVMLLTSLHLLAAEDVRVRTVWALGFVAAFAAMIFTNYAVQTTVVPGLVKQWVPDKGPLLSALTMANPHSLGWALEMWGYGVLGVATWLCAPVFAHGALERVTALLFRVNGPISILGIFATILRPGWVMTGLGLAAFALWNILIIAMTVLVLAAMRARKDATWKEVNSRLDYKRRVRR